VWRAPDCQERRKKSFATKKSGLVVDSPAEALSPLGKARSRGRSSPSSHPGRQSANGFPLTMKTRGSTCSTSAPNPGSQSKSPAKTVASSFSISTEPLQPPASSLQPASRPAAEKCLATRSGGAFSRMMLEVHEILPNHILPLEISGAKQHRQRPLAFFRPRLGGRSLREAPSLPPYPLTPRRLSEFWLSPVRRAKKQIPSKQILGSHPSRMSCG
jgi:hypothetical protein